MPPVNELLAAPPLADHLDEIGPDESLESRLERPGHGRDGAKERPVEYRPKHGRLLQEPPLIGGQPIDA